jgi:diadenosine tetraphosphate (Ap4A) HIT family hydrolase
VEVPVLELEARALGPPVVPEPPRDGEHGVNCRHCASPEEPVVFSDEHWIAVLRDFSPLLGVMLFTRDHHDSFCDLSPQLQSQFGPLAGRIERALLELGDVARVHLYRWGDGSAHFHVHFIPRPLGLLDLRWFYLPLWERRLPAPAPEQIERARVSLTAALS